MMSKDINENPGLKKDLRRKELIDRINYDLKNKFNRTVKILN